MAELGYIWLPESLAGPNTKFVFAKVEVERAIETLRPDLLLYTKAGKALAVEIFVTHEVDSEKAASFAKSKLACVEYRLGQLPRELSYEDLKQEFVGNRLAAAWVFNEKAAYLAQQRQRAEETLRAREEARRLAEVKRQAAELRTWLVSPHAKARELTIHRGLVDRCPKQRRGRTSSFSGLAYVEVDCAQCVFFAGQSDPETLPGFVKCIGHFPKLALQDDDIIRRFGGKPSRRERSPPYQEPAIVDSVEREPDPF